MISILLNLFISLSFAAEAPKAPAQGQPMAWVAHLLRQKENQIDGLKLTQTRLPVMLVPHKGELRPLVEVPLNYFKEGWQLYDPTGKKVRKNKDTHQYSVFAFLNSQVNELVLTAKNEQDEKQEERIYIFAPEVQEFEIVSPWSSVYATLGVGYLTYEQTRFGVLVWKGATAGIGYNTQESSSPWDYNFYLRMTILSFQTQPIAANPQYINGHGQISYRMPWGQQTRWRYYSYLGVGYFSMNSFGSDFGFSALIAPHLSFRAKKFISTKSSLLYDFKVTPFENFDLDTSRNFELSFTWSKALKSSRRQDLSLQYENTRFISGTQQISLEYISLNLGYSL